MKASTTTGHDGISSNLLKAALPEINSILIHIFNLSLSNGVVPSQLQIAKVVHIYKAGDSQLFNNYRPISILPSISKVLERIIYNRIFDFVSYHNILCPDQYGSNLTELPIWHSTTFTQKSLRTWTISFRVLVFFLI